LAVAARVELLPMEQVAVVVVDKLTLNPIHQSLE
jgi:hypothetical protein